MLKNNQMSVPLPYHIIEVTCNVVQVHPDEAETRRMFSLGPHGYSKAE